MRKVLSANAGSFQRTGWEPLVRITTGIPSPTVCESGRLLRMWIRNSAVATRTVQTLKKGTREIVRQKSISMREGDNLQFSQELYRSKEEVAQLNTRCNELRQRYESALNFSHAAPGVWFEGQPCVSPSGLLSCFIDERLRLAEQVMVVPVPQAV